MSFNSLTFLVFFTAVYALYRLPINWDLRKGVLIAAGWVFYGWFDLGYLALLTMSTAVDYLCGLRLGRETDPGRRRLILAASVGINLMVLGVFKYLNFFLESFTSLLSWFGADGDPFRLGILLPVGMSFYTFQKMGYVIDVYRRDLPPVDSFRDFTLFVGFFPTLLAGPIMRAGDFLPQLREPRTVDGPAFRTALSWIVTGYFFKVGVADNLAHSVHLVFDVQSRLLPSEAWLGAYYFSAQIFCDFAGYTLLARGFAKLLGFDVPENFRAPYLACGFSDFWRRWHITLSRWLRDYLYIPLGGNRGDELRTYRNIMVTMLLGGLWHGASWTFVLWGGVHGALLVAERKLKTFSGVKTFIDGEGLMVRLTVIFVVFNCVALAWVLFRAGNTDVALKMFSAMFNPWELFTDQMPSKRIIKDAIWMVPVISYFTWAFIRERRPQPIGVPVPVTMLGLAVLAFITVVCREATDAFLYFQY
ncbi:MAG: MBOAT family protein [Pseudomonadota bacterium]